MGTGFAIELHGARKHSWQARFQHDAAQAQTHVGVRGGGGAAARKQNVTRKTALLWAHADRAQGTNPCDDDRVDAFRKISGVPTVLNASFNESEPLVDPRAHALACF